VHQLVNLRRVSSAALKVVILVVLLLLLPAKQILQPCHTC
jgi:hypothetical protein